MNERDFSSEMSIEKKGAPSPEQKSRTTKGRYLKQPPTKKRRRRRRRKLNPRFVILMTVLLAMVIALILGIRRCTKPTIIGRWDLDGTTVYEFYKGGKGALVLMTGSYDFTYEIEDDQIYINFVDEHALDAWYTFNVDGNMLFMTGGPGDAKTEYVFQKMK